MTPIKVTCAILIDQAKVFAAQRSTIMAQPLKWEFPGGKLLPEESEEEGLKREIQEELNISIAINGRLTPVVHDYGHIKIQLIPLLATHIDGEITLQEHLQYGWFSLEELNGLDWAPADLPIVEELVRRLAGT